MADEIAAPVTIAAEFAAEMAKIPVEADAPVVAASTETNVEPIAAEPEKIAPVVETPSMARRLAMIAAAEKRSRDEAAAKTKVTDENAPLLEKIRSAKTAKTKMEGAKIALDLDDEGLADLFLELNAHHAGERQAVSPEAKIEALVQKKLDEKLAERDRVKTENEQRVLTEQREAYTGEALQLLEDRGDEWPLVAIAYPTLVDITSISEAWLLANGEIPEPEAVLKLIQDERQQGLDKRRAAAEARKPKITAPVKTGEASGTKTKPPVATNDAPVSPPKKLTIAEELANAFKVAGVSAAQ